MATMMPEHTLTKDTGAGMARTQEGLHIWLHGEGETRVWAGALKEGIGRRRADHVGFDFDGDADSRHRN
jgi:hypothetical protein